MSHARRRLSDGRFVHFRQQYAGEFAQPAFDAEHNLQDEQYSQHDQRAAKQAVRRGTRQGRAGEPDGGGDDGEGGQQVHALGQCAAGVPQQSAPDQLQKDQRRQNQRPQPQARRFLDRQCRRGKAGRGEDRHADEQAEDYLGETAVDNGQLGSQPDVQHHTETAEQSLKDHAGQSGHAEPLEPVAPRRQQQSDRQHNDAATDDVTGQSMRMLDHETRIRLAPIDERQMPGNGRPDRIGHADLEGRDHRAESQ